MIGKVVTGSDVRGLVRYLYGPGRANEHTDPHLAGAWTDPVRVEPALDEHGRRDLGRLVALLEAPLAASVRVPEASVWHCALRAAPTDRRLTDAEWDDVARKVLHRTGLSSRGDSAGCRWVAVRHAEDHVHLVATLARQDGRAVSTFRDFFRVGEACRAVEDRYGLTVTPARDRTAARRPTRAETEKALRTGRAEPPRVTLAREVRYAAVAAATEDEFFTGLRAAGVMVRPRYSERMPGQVTGYAAALPANTTADGQPVWFGGGKLAPDLAWPQLQQRWVSAGAPRQYQEPQTAYREATAAARRGAATLRQSGPGDPAGSADLAAATADMMVVTARVVEGRRPGPLIAAAGHFDRAWREPRDARGRNTAVAHGLREAARMLARASRPHARNGQLAADLIEAIGSLVLAVAELRAAQLRDAQATAAHQAAATLTAYSTTVRREPAVAQVLTTAPRHARQPHGPPQPLHVTTRRR